MNPYIDFDVKFDNTGKHTLKVLLNHKESVSMPLNKYTRAKLSNHYLKVPMLSKQIIEHYDRMTTSWRLAMGEKHE